MSRRSLAWFVLCALHTAGCSDSSSGTAGERDASATLDAAGPSIDGGSTERKVSGRVIDAQSVATLANAELTTESEASTSSQSDGRYELVAGPSDRDLTAARKSFAATYKPLPSAAGTLDVYLKSVDEGAQFRGDEGITVTLASGVKLVIPKDAVTDAEGNKVAGLVSLELAAIDGKQPTQAASLPGDMTAEQKDSKQGRLSVDDGLSIRIVDAENKELTVDKGADVVAEVPARKDADGPQSVYSYDTKERRWKEEGTAPLGMNGEGKAVYRADIDHLSWWALGRFFEKVGCVRACVEDADGKPVAGAQVWVVGESVAGVSTFHTDKSGCGAGDAIAAERAVLVAQAGLRVSSSRKVTVTSEVASAADPGSCTDGGVLTVGDTSDQDCALCSVTPDEPSLDAGLSDAAVALDASMDASTPMDAGESDAAISIDDAGIIPSTEQSRLTAPYPDFNDNFGFRVAIAGDTVVIGAPNEGSNATTVNGDETNDTASDSGAVYVFVRSGNDWVKQAYLKASNADPTDNFGYAVAISGDTIVVGAPGEDSYATGINGDQNDDSLLGSGAAYVFVRNASTWTQQAYLKADISDQNDAFGRAVAISNNTVVVGAPLEDSDGSSSDDNSIQNSGAAYVFLRSGATWSELAYLKASNPDINDQFGGAVTIDGTTIVVGAVLEDSAAPYSATPDQGDNSALDSGAAYVFVQNGTTFSQQAYLKASNTGADDEYGESLALAGNVLVVGASGEDSAETQVNGPGTADDSAASSGAAYVYVRVGSDWILNSYLKARDGAQDHDFGESVAVETGRIVVGAFQDRETGSAIVFENKDGNWVETQVLTPGNAGPGDWFGKTLAISAGKVIVGAPQQIDGTGGAYVFALPAL